jgi:hypothetical protein
MSDDQIRNLCDQVIELSNHSSGSTAADEAPPLSPWAALASLPWIQRLKRLFRPS